MQAEPLAALTAEQATKRIIIIGGGIAGLSASWYLQQNAKQRHLALHVTVLEASPRWGGKILTESVDGFGNTPFILEAGPDALLTHKPWGVTLARELALEGYLASGDPANNRTFVLLRNRLTPLPAGLQLLVPTRFWAFVRSPLFSPWGKLRIGLETIIPSRQGVDDESLANFVLRRFGREALETLAEPLMADVYNMASSLQSMRATFPLYPALEARYGSVIRGARVAARQRKRLSEAPAQPFVSFDGGTQTLVNALVGQLDASLRLRSAVRQVERLADSSYGVVLTDGSQLIADAVILATPAHVASALLREAAPSVSSHLSAIGYASIGSIYLAFRRQDTPYSLNGYGMVIPRAEGRHIDGMSWTSSKWTGRAPANHILLRIFFGGPRTRDLIALDEGRLLAVARAEVAALLGIHADPLFHRVYRWNDGYPQYDVGHLARVDAIEAKLPPGLFVTGSAYRGVGLPDCIRQGQEAAQRAISALTASSATMVS